MKSVGGTTVNEHNHHVKAHKRMHKDVGNDLSHVRIMNLRSSCLCTAHPSTCLTSTLGQLQP